VPLTEGEQEIDRQWSVRYTQEMRYATRERNLARRRAEVLRTALAQAIQRLEALGDRDHAALVRVLDNPLEGITEDDLT
jgi:hypothetical protein